MKELEVISTRRRLKMLENGRKTTQEPFKLHELEVISTRGAKIQIPIMNLMDEQGFLVHNKKVLNIYFLIQFGKEYISQLIKKT